MTNQPNKRKRGRPPTGKPPAKRIGFYVSEADHIWLTALTNRSAWLSEKVARERGTLSGTVSQSNPGESASTEAEGK